MIQWATFIKFENFAASIAVNSNSIYVAFSNLNYYLIHMTNVNFPISDLRHMQIGLFSETNMNFINNKVSDRR